MNKLTNREKKRIVLWIVLIIVGLVVYFGVYRSHAQPPEVALLKPLLPTATARPPKGTVQTVTGTVTQTATVDVTNTPGPSLTPAPTATQGSGNIAPYPNAPLCADSGANHDYTKFHTLWDATRGCHYNHEHGQDPFIPSVANTFPGFDLFALLGNVQVGHTNPSSPIENVAKHGGMKWNVQLANPEGCDGFESAATGVNGSVIQYHGYGDYAIEAEARLHSTVALLRQCKASNPTDFGYVFINQLQDYGQRVVPYQGTIVGYPNQPQPSFPSPRGPYLSIDCVGGGVIQCRSSLADVLNNNRNAVSIWTSKVTGAGHSDTPNLFRLLWAVGDMYRLFDWTDQSYPFTLKWLCSSDGGNTYNPVGCRYNNTTTQVKEIAGTIPSGWDGLAGFDSDPRAGRVTGEGFTNGAGTLMLTCSAPGMNCFPIKLVGAFTGSYGALLVYSTNKGTNIQPPREGDILFNGVPSGWVGAQN